MNQNDVGDRDFVESKKVVFIQKNKLTCGSGTHGMDDFYCRVSSDMTMVKACLFPRCSTVEQCGEWSYSTSIVNKKETDMSITCVMLSTAGLKMDTASHDKCLTKLEDIVYNEKEIEVNLARSATAQQINTHSNNDYRE